MQRLILVVDDEPLMLELFSRIISLLGYACAVAVNGADAVALLESGLMPDLVIMDLLMPVMNGIDCMAWIRRQPNPLGDVPVIVVSAARNLGTPMTVAADHVLAKPFSVSQLDAAIGHALERHRLRSGEGYVPYVARVDFSRN